MAQSVASRNTSVRSQWATLWKRFSSSFQNHSSLPNALPACHHYQHHPKKESTLLKGHVIFCASYGSQALASDRAPLDSNLQSASDPGSNRNSETAPQKLGDMFEREGVSARTTTTRGEQESDSSRPLSTSGGHKQAAPVDPEREAAVEAVAPKVGTKRLCYYWTQGKCDQGWNANHTDQHAHKYPELPVRPADWRRVRPQPFDKYLILDLEGRVEILEFPVVLLDPKTLKVLDRFHRFVCPVKMSDEYITQYVKGKYGPMGIHRVWFDTAIPFTQVLDEFEVWLEGHGLWRPPSNESAQQTSGAENDGSSASSDEDRGPEEANEAASTSGKLQNAAFVTCGNWDIKTKIAEQCVSSEIDIPPYFNEWINIKDIYVNHYRRNASGMRPMLRDLQLPLWGTHHVGLDDAHNIARIMQRMLVQGARFVISGQRMHNGEIKFLFRRRAK